MRRIFGLVPNVFFLGLVSFFNDFSAEMIIAVMPAFLVSLGAAPIFIGFIEGFADALASILRIISGRFSDCIRRRKIISVWGYSLSVATRSVLYFVTNIWQVFFLRAIDRVGKGVRESPRDALLAESVEGREVGKSFGYQRAMDAVGGVLGPVAAVLIFPAIGGSYRTLFMIAFAVGIFAVVSFVFVRESPKVSGGSLRENSGKKLGLKDFSPDFRKYLVAVFVFGLGAFPISLILLRSGALGSLATYIPLMYLIYNISFTLFAIPFGRLADAIGDRAVIIYGFIAAIASYLLLAFGTSPLAIVVSFILFGLYSAMTNGIERALTSKFMGTETQATGQGYLGAATGISSLLAGVVGGAVWTSFGPTPALLYGASMMAIGVILLFGLNGLNRGV